MSWASTLRALATWDGWTDRKFKAKRLWIRKGAGRRGLMPFSGLTALLRRTLCHWRKQGSGETVLPIQMLDEQNWKHATKRHA